MKTFTHSLADELQRAAAQAPDRPFIRMPAGEWTYGEVDRQSDAVAAGLYAQGVRQDHNVSLMLPNCIEFALAWFARAKLGAVCAPLNTSFRGRALAQAIDLVESRLLVVHASLWPQLAEVRVQLATVKKLVVVGDAVDPSALPWSELLRPQAVAPGFPDCTFSSLCLLLYTSGTTGRSKGAMLTHDNLASNSFSLVDYWRFTDKDVLIHALPIYHTHGLFVASNVTLFARASMIFLPKLDPELIIKLMARATVLMGVPTFYTRLLQSPSLTKESAKHMRLFISGSAPLLADTHREWSARTGFAILERYGMTETNMNTSNPYDGDRVPGAVGLPLPGVSVRVTDPETGKEIARDTIGMIEVKGPNVFKGYWRMPEKTKAEFRDDGFFITGDLGKIDDKGYVHILGRGKDLVISGGFNVYPKEIESEIDAMPGVVESAVIGVPHADFGEGVTAVVVCNKGADVSEAGVLKALDGRLAKFKMPKRVFVVDELPRNAMGKVQKNILRDTYKDIYAK